jgi:hypothetical protein
MMFMEIISIKWNELRRHIVLFRDLKNNQIKALPNGIFDQLEDLQIL